MLVKKANSIIKKIFAQIEFKIYLYNDGNDTYQKSFEDLQIFYI